MTKKNVQSAVCVARYAQAGQKKDEEGYPYLDQKLTVHCFECGHCMAVCPAASLVFSKTPIRESPEIDEKLKISKQQAYQFLRSNRSIRNFTDERVTREEITELLELAACAPTGGNIQDVEWIVIDSREKLAEISKIVRNYLENLVKKSGNMWVTFRLRCLELIENMFSGMHRWLLWLRLILRLTSVLR